LRRQGAITLVPPPGKQFFYLVDDINMPAAEQYGAQPPLEMLRLLLGHKGVWDRRTLTYKLVEGVCLLACGTTGRADLPPRLLRFFNSLYLPEPEEDSLVLIFGELSKGFFQKYKLKPEVT
jgi:dynein heavy chain